MRKLNSKRDLAKYIIPRYLRILRLAKKKKTFRGVRKFLEQQNVDFGICKFLCFRDDVTLTVRAEKNIAAIGRHSPARYGIFWAPCASEAFTKAEALDRLEVRVKLLRKYL